MKHNNDKTGTCTAITDMGRNEVWSLIGMFAVYLIIIGLTVSALGTFCARASACEFKQPDGKALSPQETVVSSGASASDSNSSYKDNTNQTIRRELFDLHNKYGRKGVMAYSIRI